MVGLVGLFLTAAISAPLVFAPSGNANCTPLQSSRGVCAYSNRNNVALRGSATADVSGSIGRSVSVSRRESKRTSTKHTSCGVVCEYLKTHPDDPSLHLALRQTPGSAVVTPL